MAFAPKHTISSAGMQWKASDCYIYVNCTYFASILATQTVLGLPFAVLASTKRST